MPVIRDMTLNIYIGESVQATSGISGVYNAFWTGEATFPILTRTAYLFKVPDFFVAILNSGNY